MGKQFQIEQLDQKRLIKQNDLNIISNPSMFNSNNGPTPDGLLSNEIFGLTKDERSGIFAYIDLNEKFIEPYFYKLWLKLDKNLKNCIYETKTFVIDKNGYLVENDKGETGLKFLIKNIDKINFKSSSREAFINVLKTNKDKLFTDKFIVIPPFYRDVNNTGSGRVGIGEINKLYVNLMNNVRALSESNDYGLNFAGGIRGKIQDLMLEIYNWFTIGETVAGGEHTGSGIFKKFGIMRRAAMAKTTDNSCRLVLSAPNINVNSKNDLMVDMEYSALPLSAVCSLAYPYMIYYLRQFFNNEFGGKTTYSTIDNTTIHLKNTQMEFSDDRFDREITEFIKGYSNRLKSVVIPNEENKDVVMRFKGYSITEEDYNRGIRENDTLIERQITWVDLLYIAAIEAVKDKMVLITRFPVDSYFNQFASKVHIYTTIETEPMVINGVFYKWYPKIRQEDIGSNTSNKFIDTCSIANPYCVLMGADYDGDQITAKLIYSSEANEELKKYANSNAQFITLNGVNGRVADKEALQAMYNLTLVLPGTDLTKKIEF